MNSYLIVNPVKITDLPLNFVMKLKYYLEQFLWLFIVVICNVKRVIILFQNFF